MKILKSKREADQKIAKLQKILQKWDKKHNEISNSKYQLNLTRIANKAHREIIRIQNTKKYIKWVRNDQ